MPKPRISGPTLFDAIEIADDREAAECPHRHWRKTYTIWPGEKVERITQTCQACGKVTGWYYKCDEQGNRR